MKKYLFLLSSIIAILLIISCPQELTKGTTWEGEMAGTFGGLKDDNSDFELIFDSNGLVKAYISITGDQALSLEGDYILTNNYTFTAELEGEAGGINFELELEGTLNYYSGYGTGEYKMEFTGSTYEDDWELTKIGS